MVGRVGVISRSGRPQAVALQGVDVGTAATGGLDYGDRAPRAAGRWVTLSRGSLDLAPGASVDVPFAVHVPAGARSGDHVAGVVAYDPGEIAREQRAARRQGRGLRLAFRSRLAIAVVVRVPGPRHPRLTFGGAGVNASPSGVRIELRLRNSGNTLIKPTKGDVAVSQDGQPLFTTPVDLDTFAPESQIRFPIPLPGTPTQGTYHLQGTLHPNGAPAVKIDTDVEFTSRQAQRFTRASGKKVKRTDGGGFSLLYIALGFAVLAAVGFGVAYARARKQIPRRARRGPTGNLVFTRGFAINRPTPRGGAVW